jgi:CBS domain-containing protein
MNKVGVAYLAPLPERRKKGTQLMRANDIMTTALITVGPEASVRDIAALLLENQISAVPVVNEGGELVGIVSEGDLMRRGDIGTARKRSWWLELLSENGAARDYVKSHGLKASDVMTKDVVTVDPDTMGSDIAATLEKRRIKRVPVMKDGKLVGIVSRANLLHGLAAYKATTVSKPGDEEIREALRAAFDEAGIRAHLVSVIVQDGDVHLFGMVRTEAESDAVRVATENLAGATSVKDETVVVPEPVITL